MPVVKAGRPVNSQQPQVLPSRPNESADVRLLLPRQLASESPRDDGAPKGQILPGTSQATGTREVGTVKPLRCGDRGGGRHPALRDARPGPQGDLT